MAQTENEQPKISLSAKQTIAWEFLEDKVTNEILYGGGAGGGKSYLGCIWHIYRRTTFAGSRGLIGRAKISNLEQSTLVTLFKVANSMGYRQGVHFNYNSQKHTINWSNGSQTILKDLFQYPSDPDFISLGSTEYTDAFIDEAPEITLKAIELVNTRIRWNLDIYGLVPKLLLTGNPSEGAVKERFIEKDETPVILEPHQQFVQSLVSENPDEAFKKLYIQQLERLSSDYDKQRLLHGDWSASREVKSPFAVQWNDLKHISTVAEYDPKKQMIIHMDFNLTPFSVSFSHIFYDANGEHDYQFDEAAIVDGSIPAMAELIILKYKNSLPTCILTGDALGKRGEISQRDNASLYLQLIRLLNIKEGQLKVSNNPTHENSRADCNYYLQYHPDFKIHPRCKGSIRDMRNVQVDIYGQIIKRNRNDENQRADFLDNFRYKVHNLCDKWIDMHQRKNKLR